MEYLESTPNANVVDTQPRFLSIFQGKWGVFMMGGILVFLLINNTLSKSGFSFQFSTVVSSLPLVLLILYVVTLVNGKLPHYRDDLFLVGLFHLMAFLYLRGWIKRPPQLWRKVKRPPQIV